MASGEPIPLGSGFAGLDRATAAHLLQADKSPATTDAAPFNDVFGILGPRRGRKKVAAYSSLIRGIVPCNFPIGRFRLVALADGTITATAVPWPTPYSGAPYSGGLSLLGAGTTCVGGVFTTVLQTETFLNGILQTVV